MRYALFPRAAILGAAAILTAATALPTPAWAQSVSPSRDSIAAQTLFDVAKRLMGEGKFADACPKLEESQRLDPAIGTHFTMAECYERVGRLATAWVTYLDVASDAAAQKRSDREQYAKKRAAALEPRLIRLAVVVPPASATKDLQIRRDGELLREAQWGLPVPVDPGSHTVSASAPGKTTWQATVAATEEGKTLSLEVPRLAGANGVASAAGTSPAPTGPVATSATATSATTTSATPATATLASHGDGSATPSGGLGGQRVWALAVAGVGVAGVVVGSIFGAEALSKHSDSQTQCPSGACTPAGMSDVQSGQSAGNVSTIAFGVGGIAIAGAAALWLLAPSTRPTTGAVRATPLVARDGGGLALGGAW